MLELPGGLNIFEIDWISIFDLKTNENFGMMLIPDGSICVAITDEISGKSRCKCKLLVELIFFIDFSIFVFSNILLCYPIVANYIKLFVNPTNHD